MHLRPSSNLLLIAVLVSSLCLHSQEPPGATAADHPCDQFKIEPNHSRLQLPEEQTNQLLIHKVEVKYPGVAKAAHISGTVILQATISKTGEISNVHALCGPKILQEACLKAVRKWKYRPYLLNGEPVELETTITSVFRIGNTT
jgi:TonB family protein